MGATIYVYLTEENVDCWRPTTAKHVDTDVYRITGEPPDDTEHWEFKTGELVRCKYQKLSGDFAVMSECLVAFERLESN